MKKAYKSPLIHVHAIKLTHMIAESNVFKVGGDADTDGAVLSNSRRGIWGNLWDDEEEE